MGACKNIKTTVLLFSWPARLTAPSTVESSQLMRISLCRCPTSQPLPQNDYFDTHWCAVVSLGSGALRQLLQSWCCQSPLFPMSHIKVTRHVQETPLSSHAGGPLWAHFNFLASLPQFRQFNRRDHTESTCKAMLFRWLAQRSQLSYYVGRMAWSYPTLQPQQHR